MENLHIIPEDQAVNWTAKYFGKYFNAALGLCDDLVDSDIEGSIGDFFDFAETDTGLPVFLIRSDKDQLHVSNADNYYQGTMSPVAASLGINIIMVNRLCWGLFEKDQQAARQYCDFYHQLKAWAAQNLDDADTSAVIAYVD